MSETIDYNDPLVQSILQARLRNRLNGGQSDKDVGAGDDMSVRETNADIKKLKTISFVSVFCLGFILGVLVFKFALYPASRNQQNNRIVR